MKTEIIPTKKYQEIEKTLGEFGRADHHGFAYVRATDAIMMIAHQHTIGKITRDSIELYVPSSSMYTTQGYCERNAPYDMPFDIRSGGKSVSKGKTYIYTLKGKEIEVQKGVHIDKDGHVTPLGGLVERKIDKEKAREVMIVVRDRLTIAFTTAKLLSHTDRRHVSDQDVLKAVVDDKATELAGSRFTHSWNSSIKDPAKEIKNFCNRMKNEIYEAFGAYESAA